MKIHVLDDQTINKIAAGEVVERPASVLKELLENALDSGATRIEVYFSQGGKTYLSVTDNGCGMEPSDLALSVARHATSKIRNFEDLQGLQTAGFRGEALASIAAVSKVTLQSSLHGASEGACLDVEDGRVSEVKPTAPLNGTRVEVVELFRNVPARQKFLKSESGETSALKKVFKAFSLSSPHVELVLRQDQKMILQFPKQSFLARAQAVLGLKEDQCVVIEAEDRGMVLRGLVCRPEVNANTSQNIWFLADGRPVSDRTLQSALIEGFRGLIMEHQYPQAVLSLSLPVGEVDFNVHPAKTQVKFLAPSNVFRFVSKSVANSLEKAMPQKDLQQETNLFDNLYAPLGREPVQEMFLGESPVQYAKRDLNTNSQVSPAMASGRTLGPWSSQQVIGQLSNTYLVCQNQKGLCLVDQHAAHERVLFERLKRQVAEKSVPVQGALLTEMIELEASAVDVLTGEAGQKILSTFGFEVERAGKNHVGIRARPLFLVDVGLTPLMEKLAEEIEDYQASSAIQDRLDHTLATMACHGAIRAGRTLSNEEMRGLLEQMDEFSFSSFCPHGRPVSWQITTAEIEKNFKRIL